MRHTSFVCSTERHICLPAAAALAQQTFKIIFTEKGPEGQIITKELPMGFCLWSTGVSQTPFAQRIAELLGDQQKNRHALETDTHLRLNGTPLGTVYAIGDW